MSLEALKNPQDPAFTTSWTSFLFNVDAARSLRALDKISAEAVVAALAQWSGDGWTTSSASKKIYEVTGVPLVTADWLVYRSAWAYTLCLLWEIPVGELSLPDRAAEVSFTLLDIINNAVQETGASVLPLTSRPTPFEPAKSGAQRDVEMHALAGGGGEEDEEEDDEEVLEFPWDKHVEPLRPELQQLWQQVADGTRVTRSSWTRSLCSPPCLRRPATTTT